MPRSSQASAKPLSSAGADERLTSMAIFAADGMSALLIAKMSAISMIPAFIACTTSPASGGITRISVSTCVRAAISAWLYTELHKYRNFKPLMKKGLWMGSFLFGMDQMLFRGKAPWTLHNSSDHDKLKPAAECAKIDYPKPDGGRTIDFPVGDLLNPVYETLDQMLVAQGQAPQFPRVQNQSIAFLRDQEQETKLLLEQPLYEPRIRPPDATRTARESAC